MAYLYKDDYPKRREYLQELHVPLPQGIISHYIYIAISMNHFPVKVKVAILDDYQNVAFTSTNKWSTATVTSASGNCPLSSLLSVDSFPETLHDEDALVDKLHSYEIICVMRERTKFTASLLDRLPNLK